MRDTALERAELAASRGGDEFTKLTARARSELEKINATYADNIRIIKAHTQVGDEQRVALTAWAKAERDTALTALTAQQAEEQARAERAAGLPTLAILKARHEALARVTDFSSEALKASGR